MPSLAIGMGFPFRIRSVAPNILLGHPPPSATIRMSAINAPWLCFFPLASLLGFATVDCLPRLGLSGSRQRWRLPRQVLREAERKPDPVNLLKRFEERRFLQLPKLR